LATRPVLVAILRWDSLSFGDETRSRRHFGIRIAIFWRRDPFSSVFWDEIRFLLATRLILVGILEWESLFFGDETHSRRYFAMRFAFFWRRDPFSSLFCDEIRFLLATRTASMLMAPSIYLWSLFCC
jgi:hypothetical protein